jgi:DNA-binding response OmpR family regulator
MEEPQTPSPQASNPTDLNVPPAPPVTEAAPPQVSTSVQKKILLVEDDDGLADVYITRLEAEGFKTKRVPNGEDALSVAIEFRPDLILLDVMMPKISGFDVLDILRNTPETTNIRIIMLTALSQDSDRARAQQYGVDDYLVKSQVVIADVVAKIKEHLGIA